MRIASFQAGGRSSYGAVTDGGIVDLARRFGAAAPTALDFIAADLLAKARDIVAAASADHRLEDVELLPPVPAPQKIWCIGLNYPGRDLEPTAALEKPKGQYPNLFCRAPTSFVGHGRPLERPAVSDQLDYEGEIVIVIGKEARHVRQANAADHIFGLTLCNEGSVRDWSRHGTLNVTQGKNFDRSGSLGPWIVTSDELDPCGPLRITTRVNSELRQEDDTTRLLFSFPFLIEYLSTFATLKPGDHIVTGTPTGSAKSFKPPRWLVPGDVVEVEVPEIGLLRNGVMQEDWTPALGGSHHA